MADTLKTMPVGSLSDVGLDADDKVILYRDSDKGAYVITVGEMVEGIGDELTENDLFWEMANQMGSHNCIYRGKNLGSAVTDAQWAAIKAGTFEDLFLGDYWEINGVIWRIAAFDYYLNTGRSSEGTVCTDHHLVIIPDTVLYTAAMNSSNTTAGGYVGSAMYTSNLAQAKTDINNAFGSAHVLSHEMHFTNAVTSGYPSGGTYYMSTVDLMCESSAYGGVIFSPTATGTTTPNNYRYDKSQYPLFAVRHDLLTIGTAWWLRDVISASSFAYVGSYGTSNLNNASGGYGVRPAFCIYQS